VIRDLIRVDPMARREPRSRADDPSSAPKGRSNKAQANGLGEDSLPRHSPALKGRDNPLEAAEATPRGNQRLVISPLQGLLAEKEGVSLETQAVGLGFVSSPLWGSNHSQRRIKYPRPLEG